MKNKRINRKYKDRVFRIIFRDKKELLELYNAVNDSAYTNPDELTITTIEDVVYMGMKNDLSFIIGDVMNLYEHQSSYSPNLPLRGLFYFASLYREQIEDVKQKLYTNVPLHIPFPQYIVFYNGTKQEPERQELKLSDLFVKTGKEVPPALECKAVVLNINFGHNRELMEKCVTLRGYSRFVAMIRQQMSGELPFEEAVERAVDTCIRQGILSEILRKNRSEVIDMILTEYNEEEFREFLKEESWKEGHTAGLETGIRGVINTCKEFHLSKEEIVRRLQEEFSLSENEAEQYVEKVLDNLNEQ